MMKIIYLEDNINDAQLIKLYTDSIGTDLTICGNLDEFWATIPLQYDMVLVDIRLRQGRHGLDVPLQLRNMGYDKMVVAVTALTTPHDQQECEQAGFTSILVKPFTIDQLASVIDQPTV